MILYFDNNDNNNDVDVDVDIVVCKVLKKIKNLNFDQQHQ
jgi:hypothetical protein